MKSREPDLNNVEGTFELNKTEGRRKIRSRFIARLQETSILAPNSELFGLMEAPPFVNLRTEGKCSQRRPDSIEPRVPNDRGAAIRVFGALNAPFATPQSGIGLNNATPEFISHGTP